MPTNLRRTPCVGICSTTYGDLVCRGCKRYAHEIVQWNGFDEEQRSAVWRRLIELRNGVTSTLLSWRDVDLLRTTSADLGLPSATAGGPAELAYELLRRALVAPEVLAAAGVSIDPHETPMQALQAIDNAFLERSRAHYERAFKTPAL